MDYKGLGERIRKERLRLSLTQEKLAEKVNISESFMGHIERGGRKLSVDTLVNIANELNVSIDYLLLDSVEPEPNVALNRILAMIKEKHPEKLKTFLSLIRVLAQNIDEWN